VSFAIIRGSNGRDRRGAPLGRHACYRCRQCRSGRAHPHPGHRPRHGREAGLSGWGKPKPVLDVRKAAILGATGPTGRHLARELAARGIAVRVEERLAQAFAGTPAETMAADVLDPEATQRAVDGCDLVADCIGLPIDQIADHVPTARNVAGAVRRTGARGIHVPRGLRADPKNPLVLNSLAGRRAAATRAQVPALLKGLIFAPNGRLMSPSHTRRRGRVYRYYVTARRSRMATTAARSPACRPRTSRVRWSTTCRSCWPHRNWLPGPGRR
jgi:NAD(P)H-binding